MHACMHVCMYVFERVSLRACSYITPRFPNSSTYRFWAGYSQTVCTCEFRMAHVIQAMDAEHASHLCLTYVSTLSRCFPEQSLRKADRTPAAQ